MSGTTMLAASFLGPEGCGNDRTGLRPWPAATEASLRRGDLGPLHWSLVSDSDPSRFARMDRMCRLGLMAAELLDAGLDAMPEARRERIGVCVETCAGCLDTDVRFVQTPRPSVFTYTLPSMLIGEVCIRYRLKGPVLCLVSSAPASGGSVAEALEWLESGDADGCLCLGCEVVEPATAEAAGLPEMLRLQSWHACALLLGEGTGLGRDLALEGSSLESLCRALCRASPK